VRAILLLPDHRVGPDSWTRRSLYLRTRAALCKSCSECGAIPIDRGFDHLERIHVAIHHAPTCRCHWDVIAEHLADHGLDFEEQQLEVVIDLDPELW
jgi:hypothetical protein